jgi:hypothetical protein
MMKALVLAMVLLVPRCLIVLGDAGVRGDCFPVVVVS